MGYDIRSNFKKRVLDNGMTILFEKRDVPVVSMSISVKCGGINEKMHEKGISHFIEHMLYKGTDKRSAKDIAFDIEKCGGELNGFTAETVTSFWCKMPSKYFDVGLDVLGDIIKNSKFDLKELEKERKVIFEEIKMRRDSPRHYVFDKIQFCLYSGTLGADLIGTEETMNSLTRDDLIKRFKEIYVPSNLILSVVGNVEFDDLVDWADKTFEKMEGCVPLYEFENKNEFFIEKRKGIDQANLIFAYHSPCADDSKVYAAEVLVTLMAGGMSSRLFSEIREKRNLAYSIHGDLDSSKFYSHSLIYAGCVPENVNKVKDLILAEFVEVSENLTEEELNNIKEQLIGSHQISMEDSQNQMVHLLISELDTKAEDFYDYEKHILDVKLGDVKDLARSVSSLHSTFVLMPEN
jgi:predicted Zn-dependent peptidase